MGSTPGQVGDHGTPAGGILILDLPCWLTCRESQMLDIVALNWILPMQITS